MRIFPAGNQKRVYTLSLDALCLNYASGKGFAAFGHVCVRPEEHSVPRFLRGVGGFVLQWRRSRHDVLLGGSGKRLSYPL